MKKSDDLFNLIKSLSRSEKGYFKKYAFANKTTDAKNYFRLFEFINDQPEYNEDLILQQFKGEKFTQQLHRVKNYLYNLILKSMRVYHSHHSAGIIVKEKLQDIHFLFEKGLLQQSKKLLRSAKEMARTYEKFSALLEILEWERKIVSLEAYSLEYADLLAHVISEREHVMKVQANLHEYEKVFDVIDPIVTARFVARSKKEFAPLRKIVRHPLLKLEKNALSYRAKILFNYILGAYYLGTGDITKAFNSTLRRREVIESRPEFIDENPEDYITVLRHLLLFNLYKLDFTGFKKILTTLRNLPAYSPEVKAQIFEYGTLYELQYCVITGQFKRGLRLIEKIESEMPEHENLITPLARISFPLFFSYNYLGAQEYHKALKSINKVLNNNSYQLRQDLLGFARILNLMIHYELGNYDLIDYAVKSTYRFLDKKNKLYTSEKKILDFFKRLISQRLKGQEVHQSFRVLYTELTNISENSSLKNNVEAYLFIFWLESKIQNLPMEEIIKKYIVEE